MSTAARLVKLAEGLDANGVLSAAKGGTGGTTGGGTTSPTISAIGYGGDDTATNPAGGATITLTGTNFASGAKVLINTTPVSVVTVVSSTQITFTAPALAAGSYILYVVNLDGSTAIAVPGIQYSGTPAWTTAAGSLGSSYETAAVSTTVSATSDSAVTYSVVSGTLPSGVTINSSGTISGTSPIVSGSTTYTFTVRATDLELQDTDREFSLTINPDVVTWSSATAFAIQQDAASTTTLSATSATGQTVSYSVDTLPAGLTLSGAVVSGTPTTAGTTTTTATATAAVTGKTAQQTITWTVSIAADTYFPYTTLLLNTETSVQPFLADASTNNFALTAFGDTRASNFSPYVPIASSVYFNGSSDYLTSSGNATIATGEFTIEAWIYPTSFNASNTVLDNSLWNIGQNGGYTFYINSTGKVALGGSTGVWNSSTTWLTSTSSVVTNRWQHVAITRDSSNVIRCFINGVLDASTTTYSASLNLSTAGGITTNISRTVADGGSYNYFPGYISNVHAANGTGACKYTNTFTPSVYPIAKTSTTVFLACNSRRLVDASTNAFTLTAGGTAAVNNFNPFLTNPSYGTYGSTYFDGSGDYISIPTGTAAALGTTGTVEFWYYPITSPATARIINNGISAATCMDVYDANGQIGFSNAGYTTSAVKLNTWTHIACVINAGVLKIYFNGVSQPLAGTTTGLNLTATGDVWIGGINGYSQWTNGYVSNLRFVKGTAVYTADFTPPTEPLTAVANTSLLTCQTNQPHTNSQFLDNSTSALTITRTGNTTQGSFSPYGANWSNYFDGTGDYLSLPSAATTYLAANPFTIEAWVYPTAENNVIIGRRAVVTARGFWLAYGNITSKKFSFYAGDTNNANWEITLTTTNAFGLNQWHHVAVTRNASNVFTIWVNGVAEASATSSFTMGDDTSTLYIGAVDAGSTPFTGYISNLRLVQNTALYTTTFTPSTTPLTPVTGTGLLTCQSPNLVDNSLNASTITKAGDVSVQKFSPFSTVTQTPVSHSVYFDGTGDYLSAPQNTALNFGTGDFTVEAWIYVTSTANSDQTILASNQSWGAGAVVLKAYHGGNISFTAYDNSSGGTAMVSYATTLNTWTHVALTRSGTTFTLYVNGVSRSTATSSISVNFAPAGGTYIGYAGPINSTTGYLYGYISNLRAVKGTAVYTSAFTPSTTPLTAVANTSLLTCQSATLTDNSVNNFTLTAAGDTKPRQQNPFGYTTSSAQDYTPSVFGSSAYFDGTNDKLTIANYPGLAFGTSDFTIQGWFYTIASATEQVFATNGWSSYAPWLIRIDSGNILRLNMSTSGGSWDVNEASLGTVTPNQWYHVAVTRISGTLRAFVNGVQQYTATLAGSLYNGSQALNVGGRSDASVPFKGYLSDVQLINGKSLYAANFVPPSAPLTAVQNTTLLLNMDRAAVVDRSGKVVLETVGDAKISASVRKYGSASLYFDGTGDQLYSAATSHIANFGTGDFTVEFWIYLNTVPTNTAGILSTYTSGNFYINFRSSGTIALTDASTVYASTASALTAGSWFHIAVVRSSGSSKIYTNGVGGTAVACAANWSTPSLTYIGSDPNGTINGYIDDLRVTKGYARYTANFTPPQQALLTK